MVLLLLDPRAIMRKPSRPCKHWFHKLIFNRKILQSLNSALIDLFSIIDQVTIRFWIGPVAKEVSIQF